MASILTKYLASYQVGLRGSYTLLGSKHLIKQLGKTPIMHATGGEQTNA
jgi:hypothetical protein